MKDTYSWDMGKQYDHLKAIKIANYEAYLLRSSMNKYGIPHEHVEDNDLCKMVEAIEYMKEKIENIYLFNDILDQMDQYPLITLPDSDLFIGVMSVPIVPYTEDRENDVVITKDFIAESTYSSQVYGTVDMAGIWGPCDYFKPNAKKYAVIHNMPCEIFIDIFNSLSVLTGKHDNFHNALKMRLGIDG